ncbi:hypothetical protein QAD02_003157 [Eretmocerus hayati]|uniref:Uncharacterized protein n=1 Tax=Eretmocerus hayati TaxID=131215 RepID=A0ACC2NM80_9HYME|nr:hypothetical protein QAD02_003157 [Eretmocerus hayati]
MDIEEKISSCFELVFSRISNKVSADEKKQLITTIIDSLNVSQKSVTEELNLKYEEHQMALEKVENEMCQNTQQNTLDARLLEMKRTLAEYEQNCIQIREDMRKCRPDVVSNKSLCNEPAKLLADHAKTSENRISSLKKKFDQCNLKIETLVAENRNLRGDIDCMRQFNEGGGFFLPPMFFLNHPNFELFKMKLEFERM